MPAWGGGGGASAGVLPVWASPDAGRLQIWVLQRQHKNGEQLVVVENGRVVSFVSLPPQEQAAEGGGGGGGGGGGLQAPLCFADHAQRDADSRHNWDLLSERCWQESKHVHAHVHRGEIVEDVLLEQCLEEGCCALPMASWEVSVFSSPDPYHDEQHEHRDGCGHNQVAHGDHNDWLIPLADGSFLLSHAHTSADGTSQFFEHGRLVKVGELRRRASKQLQGFFTFQSPAGTTTTSSCKRNSGGYEPLPKQDDDDAGPGGCAPDPLMMDMEMGMGGKMKILEAHEDEEGSRTRVEHCSVRVAAAAEGEVEGPGGLDKTVLNVMGMCCPAEVPLIKKILEALGGVEEVCVNVTARTATVLHDPMLVSDGQLVKALNEARLDASIHERGQVKGGPRWPNPCTLASGLLLALAFFHYLYGPLRWVALGAVAVGLPRVLLRGLVALRRLVLDINILMVLAVAGAIALGDYLEAASITFLFTLAEWLESRSSDKARAAMAAVLGRAPRHAVLLDTGVRVRVEDVKVGTALAVRAGELIPIDGVVTSGKSSVDQSTLTGESVPVEKEPDSTVWAGTMNLTGYVSIKTSALSENSAVARMVKLVEEAQIARSRTEQMVETFAKYYTPVVVVAAVLVAVVPAAVGVHDVRHWLYLALVLLVVACPCALVISTPVTTTCAIAQAARLGLLIKGGTHLEALGNMKVLAMDKTGTMTEGHFRVLDVNCLDGRLDLAQLLHWVGSVESKASHPMAAAMTAYARAHGAEPSKDVQNFEVLAGEGVSALVEGRLVRIGNLRLATRLGWAQDSVAAAVLDGWKSKEAASLWVGVDDKLVAVMCAGDQVRAEAAEAISDLKKAGIRVVMLTGDSDTAAAAVRRQIGDIEVHSQLLPEDKVRLIKQHKAQHGVTGMIGDGINDAPALVAADVGIAMGVAGSAVAMETADVALMSNDLRKVAAAVLLAQACLRKVQHNVFLSFVTKAAIVVLAALGYASLWAAVVADVGTCLLVTFNSMLLLKKKKKKLQHHNSKTTTKHHHHNKHHGTAGHGHEVLKVVAPPPPDKHHHHHHHHGKHPEQGGLGHGECSSPPQFNKQPMAMEERLEHEGGSGVLPSSHAHAHAYGQCCSHGHDLESSSCHGHEHALQKCCHNSLFAWPSVGTNLNVRRRWTLGGVVKDAAHACPPAKDGHHHIGCNNLVTAAAPCCSHTAHAGMAVGDASNLDSGPCHHGHHGAAACADQEHGHGRCCGPGQQLPPPAAGDGHLCSCGSTTTGVAADGNLKPGADRTAETKSHSRVRPVA